MSSGLRILTIIVLLTVCDIYCIKCYHGTLGATKSLDEEDHKEDYVCAMSLSLPCSRRVRVSVYSHEKVEHSKGCESDLFSLKCKCDFSYCNGDMKDFKKMWESSPNYRSTSEETRCLLKAYYVAYPTTTTRPSTTTETTSEMLQTTTDSEEEMGKLKFSRKSVQIPQAEKQISRKKYYKEEEEEEKAAERADTIMITIFVCLCVIFVSLVVLAIVLILTGPKDPMTRRKVRGKRGKKKRKK